VYLHVEMALRVKEHGVVQLLQQFSHLPRAHTHRKILIVRLARIHYPPVYSRPALPGGYARARLLQLIKDDAQV